MRQMTRRSVDLGQFGPAFTGPRFTEIARVRQFSCRIRWQGGGRSPISFALGKAFNMGNRSPRRSGAVHGSFSVEAESRSRFVARSIGIFARRGNTPAIAPSTHRRPATSTSRSTPAQNVKSISPWIYGMNGTSLNSSAHRRSTGRQSLDCLQLGDERVERRRRLLFRKRQLSQQQQYARRRDFADSHCRRRGASLADRYRADGRLRLGRRGGTCATGGCGKPDSLQASRPRKKRTRAHSRSRPTRRTTTSSRTSCELGRITQGRRATGVLRSGQRARFVGRAVAFDGTGVRASGAPQHRQSLTARKAVRTAKSIPTAPTYAELRTRQSTTPARSRT